MQIPLLSGIAASGQAEFVQTYPQNLEPVAIDNKLAKGQLRATSGAIILDEGPGIDRGGATWNAQHYRVMGTELVKVAADGGTETIEEIGGSGQVRFDYSFAHLGIRSSGELWLYDGTAATQVTDEDLGQVVDAMHIDGYWMTTDGTSVIVTELSDPFSVHPLKYGSAEADPDPITGLMKVRGEPYIINRHTIQVFRNVGGNGFPFANQEGATIPYGCVGADAKCLFAESFAFVGSSRDQGLGVYVAGSGTADKISTRTIDDALASVADPTGIILESRAYRDEERLFVHLPDESWCFLKTASLKVQEAVWYRCTSGAGEQYRIRNAIPAYGGIICGDAASANIGSLSDDVSTHFGEAAEAGFDCGLIPGPGTIQSAELIGLPGRAPSGVQPSIFMSFTKDGETWSIEKAISMGAAGERRKRLRWPLGIRFATMLGLRFRFFNEAMPGFARCEADVR